MSIEVGSTYEHDAAQFNEIIENLPDVAALAEEIIGKTLLLPFMPEGAEAVFDTGSPICGSLGEFSEVDEVDGGSDPPEVLYPMDRIMV